MTTEAITPLRQHMIEDMNARKLCAGTQRGHIRSCKRFAAFLKRSPDTASLDDVRRFQLYLAETGVSICTRNRIMTGLRFLLQVTRRLDLAEEVYHLREPQKLPLVMSVDEMKRLLAVAGSLKTRVLLSLGYGCGLRASEIVRLKVKHVIVRVDADDPVATECRVWDAVASACRGVIGGKRIDLDRFESRNDAQRVLTVNRFEIVASEHRGDPLGVIGRGPIWEIRAVDDLRDRNELSKRGKCPDERNLRGVVVETIQLGLDLLAGEFALVRRGRDHLHQQSFRNG
jgi:hypothetical protein